jgi:hypothetical protein
MIKHLALLLALLVGFIPTANAQEKSVSDPPPDATLLVSECGEVVVMWIFYEGRLLRTDGEHHPDTFQEYAAFVKWATSGKTDEYKLLCKDKK